MESTHTQHTDTVTIPRPQTNWWRVPWEEPSTTGSDVGLRYAYFPMRNRLAIETHGIVRFYDTGKHQFRGTLQFDSDGALSFADQRGRANVADLAVVEPTFCFAL